MVEGKLDGLFAWGMNVKGADMHLGKKQLLYLILSAIATGACNNLIERAADVTLKERRQLILVPREAPYSSIHLENMLKLSNMGAVIVPASPGFYHQPQTIDDLVDFVVARILNLLNIPQDMLPRWGEHHVGGDE